ncbi:MAG: bifunctional proline dehydrogenase/L-glutamate gamma-semialdehyde dehydrogenase [Chlamydiales bacterium]
MRIADQLRFLIKKFGVPQFLPWGKRMQLIAFKNLGTKIPQLSVPLAQHVIKKKTEQFVLPGERGKLYSILQKRRREGVRINLNHLGEAILGEQEADKRLQVYLDDLASPDVEYISVKISSIFSQINLLAWEQTVEILASRLRLLYRAARDRFFTTAEGKKIPKFVNLDMEEYRDLHLTIAAFRKVLDEPEFFHHSAGVVLQSYIPDSYLVQQELTLWAMQRVSSGGAPIKLRIVKGANLMMEQFEAALNQWPQAPYDNKHAVDANFKRMLEYACRPEHAQAVYIGVGSHNLFDIAYAMILRVENGIEEYVHFEMLEGMADHMRRAVQTVTGDMLLYCPAATEKEFHTAVAYLVRRLDENTAPENFLRASFNMLPDSRDWQEQSQQFSHACFDVHEIGFKPRRTQNRLLGQEAPIGISFNNESNTDWSLAHNRKWAEEIIRSWKDKPQYSIPLVIGGKEVFTEEVETRTDPSRPGHELFTYSLAGDELIETALATAQKAQKEWSSKTVKERSAILAEVAQGFRRKRAELIGAMIGDSGKIISEGDVEVSEAIDFAEYYRRCAETYAAMEDIEWSPLGTALVAPPWNFPCAIPAGGVLSALASGNTVIFKPSRKGLAVAWEIANIFWEAGVSKEVLQFVICSPEVEGSMLVQDPRVDFVILTGGTTTAKQILEMRPGIHLLAETGGKNAIIVTALADRDLAIRDIVHSAFRHSGQKCSACSLLILEKEIYDDAHFMHQLRDAVESLRVGSAWDLSTIVSPLITPPGPKLMKGLTTLEKQEKWLLKPKRHPSNPNLWSPGIKIGVEKGSHSHQTEFFGPVLSVMRAENLEQAIHFANGTPYGLTSGLHSLDEREHLQWLNQIKVGNCYINRTITGAVVQRQPFGGCKQSSFGPGIKVGGPNYLLQMMEATQKELPRERGKLPDILQPLVEVAEKSFDVQESELWEASVGSYSYHYRAYFSKDHDPTLLQGQDNLLRYVPWKKMILRVQEKDTLIDCLRITAASAICKTPLEISGEGELIDRLSHLQVPFLRVVNEDEKSFIQRLQKRKQNRVRLVSPPSDVLLKAFAQQHANLIRNSVVANGRIELIHYLREVSISYDYHRYGNLGLREGERRRELPKPTTL